MRHVGEQRPKRDDELDVQLLDMTDDQVGERTPADVWLDPEQQDDVALETRRLRAIEGRLRPVDLPSYPVDERNVRPGRLEIEETLRIDVCDLVGAPELGEVARRERGRLGAVVPPAKRGYEDRPCEFRPGGDSKLRFHLRSLRMA